MQKMTTVLLSGADFVSLHVIKRLLEKNYKVIVALSSTEVGDAVSSKVNSAHFSFEVVPDIKADHAFDSFIKNHAEATVFLHTVFPFDFGAKDVEKELIEPAVKCTTDALESVQKYGPQIKRVVIYSCYTAIISPEMNKDVGKTWNEDSQSDLTLAKSIENSMYGYFGSRKFAEEAAWKWYADHKPSFALTTVCPSFTLGPQAYGDIPELSDEIDSLDFLKSLLKLESSSTGWPKILSPGIDSRDAAEAHIVAFESEDAKNKRLLVTGGFFTDQTYLDVLQDKFPNDSSNIPVGVPGSDVVYEEGRSKIDSSKTNNILGFKLRSLSESIADQVSQLIGSY